MSPKPIHIRRKQITRSSLFTFARAAKPEAGSGWPIFDLVEPISKGSRSDWQNTPTMPLTSCGSPTCRRKKWRINSVAFNSKSLNTGFIVCGFPNECIIDEWSTNVYNMHWPWSQCRGLQYIPPVLEKCWPLGRESAPTSAAYHQKETLHLRNEERASQAFSPCASQYIKSYSLY